MHLKNNTLHIVHFSKIFHRGCMDFKWSSPMWCSTSKQCYQTCGLGARLGYFWLSRHCQQSLTATLLLLGYFWLPGCEMSWNRASLWKIVNFLSIQGVLNLFNVNEQIYRQLIGLRRHTEPSKGIILNFRSWIIYHFFCPIGWFLVNLPHKNAQN